MAEPVSASLWAAVRKGDAYALQLHLATPGALRNRHPASGVTLLTWAALTGQTEIAALLLSQGTDVNGGNRDAARVSERWAGCFTGQEPIQTESTAAPGCVVTYQQVTPASYAETIAPMLKANCVRCHVRGGIGPFAMSSYEKVRGWSETIREVLVTHRMAPWQANPHVGCAGKYSTMRRVDAAQFPGGTFMLELDLNELRPEEERPPRTAAGLRWKIAGASPSTRTTACNSPQSSFCPTDRNSPGM